MFNTLDAGFVSLSDCVPGTLFWNRGYAGDHLGIVLDRPPSQGYILIMAFSSFGEHWAEPKIHSVEGDFSVLSFGTDWVLQPALDLRSIPTEADKPQFISHLVIGNGGQYFECQMAEGNSGRRYFPVSGGAPVASTRPDVDYLRPAAFKIYACKDALDRGDEPLLHVGQEMT